MQQIALFDEPTTVKPVGKPVVLITDAVFSPCRQWRYSLWRIWDDSRPMAMFIGLNPSTATEIDNDPTVTRCINYARDWGMGGMYMANIFAYRATDPKVMKAFAEPVGPENDAWLLRMYQNSEIAVAAWGTHGVHMDRETQVLRLFSGRPLHCLCTTKANHPGHPLYLKKSLKPVLFKNVCRGNIDGLKATI